MGDIGSRLGTFIAYNDPPLSKSEMIEHVVEGISSIEDMVESLQQDFRQLASIHRELIERVEKLEKRKYRTHVGEAVYCDE